MILTICKIKPNNKTSSCDAKVWVDTHDHDEAKSKALDKLEQEGVEVLSVVEVVATDKSDYFPPCTSLDTFVRAEAEGIAILFP